MRLSLFIRTELQQILAEWDRFARSNAVAGVHMTDLVLRDHAEEMLLAIAGDIDTPQSDAEQRRKSQGRAASTGATSAAATHGAQRHRNDFSVAQLGAEFRALRSTVLRLWLAQPVGVDADVVDQMIRFNEAIDQAIAESLVAYTDAMTQARTLLLAVLGHDLRSPLATMALCGGLLARHDLGDAQRRDTALRVQRSARLMTGMVDDLLGYTRVQFGIGLPIHRAACNVAELLHDAIADATSTHPNARFAVHGAGMLHGDYDCARLHQLFMNLLVNAAQHGRGSDPVAVDATGSASAITVRITNRGRPIPADALQSVFRPLVQLAPDEGDDARPRTSLGLGLFIAREIARGHGGTIDVASDAVEGTTFTVVLPR